MAKTKFTSGPWEWAYDDNGFYFVHAENMPSPYVLATGGEGETDKANAELAAAAPKLLKLLEEMVNEYSPFMDIPKDYKKLPGWPGDENPRMVVVKRSLDLIEKLNNL